MRRIAEPMQLALIQQPTPRSTDTVDQPHNRGGGEQSRHCPAGPLLMRQIVWLAERWHLLQQSVQR